MSLPRFTKTNSEVLDYSFLWGNWFSSGETVASASITVTESGGLPVSSITNQTSAVTFFVSSGETDAVYRVDNVIFTTQGRHAVRSFDLAVAEAR